MTDYLEAFWEDAHGLPLDVKYDARVTAYSRGDPVAYSFSSIETRPSGSQDPWEENEDDKLLAELHDYLVR